MSASRQKFWAAVETEHRSEGVARRSVRDLGIECPLLAYRTRPHRGVRRVAHLFDGYLLIRLDRRVGWSGLDRAKGVRRLLRGADAGDADFLPRIPDEEVAFLLSLVGDDGYVHIPEHDPPAFALHEAVTTTSGAFAGQVGEYRGDDPRDPRHGRVVFSLMGRELAAVLSRYDLQSLARRQEIALPA